MVRSWLQIKQYMSRFSSNLTMLWSFHIKKNVHTVPVLSCHRTERGTEEKKEEKKLKISKKNFYCQFFTFLIFFLTTRLWFCPVTRRTSRDRGGEGFLLKRKLFCPGTKGQRDNGTSHPLETLLSTLGVSLITFSLGGGTLLSRFFWILWEYKICDNLTACLFILFLQNSKLERLYWPLPQSLIHIITYNLYLYCWSTYVQLNEYETIPYFLQLNQILFVNFCVFTCFYQFLHDVIITLFCFDLQNNFMIKSCKNW